MYLKRLTSSKKTVFSLEDLGKIWGIEKDYLKVVASRLFQRGAILRVHRGLYVLRESYDLFELANKLRSPSYVSLETVLQKNNVIFQDYGSTVFSVSDNTVLKQVAEKSFQYCKIKESVLSNPLGIVSTGQAVVATAERAVCDRIYLSPQYYFDNLRGLDLKKLIAISKIYGNDRVEKEVEELIRNNE
jgi:predicted transcriptional regulator of viral defense system